MYQRYTPNTARQHSSPAPHGFKAPHNPQPMPKPNPQRDCISQPGSNKSPTKKSSISALIPPSLYNPETQKVLGLFSAEDILLAALIFLLLENNDSDDSMLVYALIYILISDYIDLPI